MGSPHPSLPQGLLHFQAVHFRHSNVEHQAPGLIGAIGIEKFPARGEGSHAQIRLPQEPAQRPKGPGVVIDNEDGGFIAHGLRHRSRWAR